MNFLKRAHIRYILHRHRITHALWEESTHSLIVLQGLSAVEKAHLRELTTLFLHRKNFIGAQGLEVTEVMRIIVSAQACLLLLGLDISFFDGWSDVIIYPGAFRISRDNTDTAGVVHHEDNVLSGESWSRGPVILSWEDIHKEMYGENPGRNVVVHELAHKLDMQNGQANGMPPLHAGMHRVQWTEALSSAYEHLQQRLAHHRRVCLNPYAATNPAEFFAVISEYFFTSPDVLHSHHPKVYQQLVLYYRQNPLQRLRHE
jgi:Mlc titration factor MtfA (ptsG expression regulator)